MNASRLLPLLGLTAASAWGVYAPIPENEQGKAFVASLGAGVGYDSNIFGAQTGGRDSFIYSLTPSLRFQANPSEQIFTSISYRGTLSEYEDRPGKSEVYNHIFSGRFAQTFSERFSVDLSDTYEIIENPASTLSGQSLNTDQTYDSNQLDARGQIGVAPRVDAFVKFRAVWLRYDASALAAQLDRDELTYGAGFTYSFFPELKGVVEYRYLDVSYSHGGASKDKTSNYYLVGADYDIGPKTTLGARFGAEDRTRSGADNASRPFIELTARYTYAKGSYLSTGYTHSIEEPSDTNTYTDTQVNRVFVNLQHALGGSLTASGSLSFEPDKLNGRGPLPDANETTTRFGAALTWTPSMDWTVSTTFDYDRVDSDDVNRGYQRARYGVTASYAF